MRSLSVYYRLLKLRFGFNKRFLEKNARFFNPGLKVKGEIEKKLKLRLAWYEYAFDQDCIRYDIKCIAGTERETITTN